MMLAAVFPLILAVAPVAFDARAHRVTFTAHATEVSAGTTVEFGFVGPDSDRAYEALFVTDARVSEIVRAIEKAGIPSGRPVDPSACRFWPAGAHVTLSPSLDTFLEAREGEVAAPLVYTSGSRDPDGRPVADTNMPSAVCAFYRLDQSLLLSGNAADQSQEYGHYVSNGKAVRGRTYTFSISWDGTHQTDSHVLTLKPGKLKESIASLKGIGNDVDVMTDFSSALTLSEAQAAAQALSVLDSHKLKINGFSKGQLFYRAFLPDPAWKDRTKRLTQPLEVREIGTNVVCTVIDEDWSVEGDDPKLTPHDVPISQLATSFKGDACLFFLSPQTQLARVYALMRLLPTSIRNWYVYCD